MTQYLNTEKYYAGVGSRATPAGILSLMRNIARELAKKGWTLRSGAADGADSAFETGANEVQGFKEIFLPYKGFRGSSSTLHQPPSAEAENMAAAVHPYFHRMAPDSFARKAHARNMHQIFGKNLATPVAFALCWTPDGAESVCDSKSIDITGGTRSAIVAAANAHIPVFNLARSDGLHRLTYYVNHGTILERGGWEPDVNIIESIKKANPAKRLKS